MAVPRDPRTTFTVPYAGETATYYERLSKAGAAPEIVLVTANEIVAVRHTTLREWLKGHRSAPEKKKMANRIRDLLLRVHNDVRLCHRDVHVDNLVVNDAGEPLLIGPKWSRESVNEKCYDLYGPDPSEVHPPDAHIRQGIPGVWWGSCSHRSLCEAFGPWPK